MYCYFIHVLTYTVLRRSFAFEFRVMQCVERGSDCSSRILVNTGKRSHILLSTSHLILRRLAAATRPVVIAPPVPGSILHWEISEAGILIKTQRVAGARWVWQHLWRERTYVSGRDFSSSSLNLN